MDNISFIVPFEIWDIILDFLDTKSLLNFQYTCHTWRNPGQNAEARRFGEELK